MAISAFAPRPIDPIIESLIAFDVRSGRPTNKHLVELLRQLRDQNLGGSRIIPCTATGTNVLVLTPNHPVAPVIERYNDFDAFAFVAANNSTGAVTATVVPATGTLATIKVYKTNGAAQAGAGDVVAGSFYLAFFVDALDAGAGGFVLK